MNELEELRREIDQIDDSLALLLKERFAVVKKIGEYKKNNGLTVTDTNRESAVYEHIARLFDNEQEKEAAKKVYSEIMSRSKELQK